MRGNLIATGGLILIVLAIRWAAVRSVRQLSSVSPELRRRWLSIVRNTSILTFLLFVSIIWAAELRTFALSLVAVAAALAISTKELTLCAIGGVLRGSGRLFEVGDRIQVGDARGDVIDIGLLTTVVLEVGPGPTAHQSTGRSITLPNALFLTNPVVNETYTQRFVIHTLVVPVSPSSWRRAMEVFLAVTTREIEGHLEAARIHFEKLASQHALPAPSPIPRVQLEVDPSSGLRLLVRFPAPSSQRGTIEQRILLAALAELEDEPGLTEDGPARTTL